METALPPKIEREVTLDTWRQLGAKLEQQKATALQTLDGIQLPTAIPSMPREELTRLTPEQKLKAILTGIDLKLEAGNFLRNENYRYLLFELSLLPEDKRKALLTDTGLGNMLTYHAVEALGMIGQNKLKIGDDRRAVAQYVHDRHCSLAIGRHFATDKALTDIYDSDQLVTVIGDKLDLVQQGDGRPELSEVASQFVSEAVLHNPHVTKEQIRGLLDQDTIPTVRLITKLAESGEKKWHGPRDYVETDYLNGFRLAQGLVCHDLAELARIAEFHVDASPVVRAIDRDMQQADNPDRKAKVFDKYAKFVLAGNICPPLKNKFEIIDTLFLHDLLPSDRPQVTIDTAVPVEKTVHEALDTLEWNWGNFLRRFTRDDGKRTSPMLNFDREKYEAAKLRNERRLIAANQMDTALRADMRRNEIEEAMLAKKAEITVQIPVISTSVKNAAEKARSAPRTFGSRDNVLTAEDEEPGNSHTWDIGDTAVPRLIEEFDLKDINMYNRDSITLLRAKGNNADFQQTMSIIRSLAEKGLLPPVGAFFWLSDGGAQLLEIHANNPYLTNDMFRSLLNGYISRIETYLDQAVAIDQSFAGRLADSKSFLRQFKTVVSQLDVDRLKSSSRLREYYLDELERMGVKMESAPSLRDIFLIPEYYRRYVPKGDNFAMVHGLPASNMVTDITDKGVQGYDITDIVLQDPQTLVPADVEIPKGGILLVLGPNNAGKTTLGKAVADSIKRAEYNEVPLFCLSMTRPENARGPVVSRATRPPETTVTESLFSSSCESLSELILSTLHNKNLPPIVLRLDEWGIGTDDIARVCILYSTLLHIRQVNPDFSFQLVTHEGEEFFALDRLLRLQPGNREILPPMQTLVLNPLTRQGTYGKLGGSLASIAVAEVDPEMAGLAQGLEEMRRSGFTEYDMRLVEDRYEEVDKPSEAFTSSIDLERMEFYDGHTEQGEFGAVKFCLDSLNVGTVAERRYFTRLFNRIFTDSATTADPSVLAYLRNTVSKFRTIPEANFNSNILPRIVEVARTGNMLFADKLDPKEFSGFIDFISDPEGFRKRMHGLEPILKFLQTDASEIAAFQKATEDLAGNFGPALDNLADQLRAKSLEFFLESTVDFHNLQADMEIARELEVDTDKLQLLNQANSNLAAELKAAAGKRSFLLSLLEKGRYDDFAILVNTYSNPKLETEEMGKTLGISKQKDASIDGETIRNCRFMDLMTDLSVKPASNTLLKSFSQLIAENGEFERVIGDIQIKDLIPPATHQAFSDLAKNVRGLVYGAGATVFTANSNALEIKWTVPTMKESGDDFPVSFENGKNPAVVHALRDSATPYIDMEFNLTRGKSGSKHNSVLLSGPNFEGKTSQMIMAMKMAIYQQMFGLVPAEKATLSPIDYVALSINAFKPDPEAGVGSLLAQALDWRRILDKARMFSGRGKKGLVAGDELWLGTESRGRTDLQAASVFQIASLPGVSAIYATHDTQLDATLDRINQGSGNPISYTHVAIENHKPLYGDKGQSQPYKILGRVLQQRGVPQDLAASIIATSGQMEKMLRSYNALVQNA